MLLSPILNSEWLIILIDYPNVIKSFKMTFKPRHRTEKLKTETDKEKDTETPESETQKDKNLALVGNVGRKRRLT